MDDSIIAFISARAQQHRDRAARDMTHRDDLIAAAQTLEALIGDLRAGLHQP